VVRDEGKAGPAKSAEDDAAVARERPEDDADGPPGRQPSGAREDAAPGLARSQHGRQAQPVPAGDERGVERYFGRLGGRPRPRDEQPERRLARSVDAPDLQRRARTPVDGRQTATSVFPSPLKSIGAR
jgi:hypothetical protein